MWIVFHNLVEANYLLINESKQSFTVHGIVVLSVEELSQLEKPETRLLHVYAYMHEALQFTEHIYACSSAQNEDLYRAMACIYHEPYRHQLAMYILYDISTHHAH